MLTRSVSLPLALLILFASSAAAELANACPFCVPVQQTFGEEMEASDAVVIVELSYAPPAETSGDGKLEKSKFKIIEVIKGEKHVTASEPIELLYYGEGKLGDHFLMMGVDPPKMAWTTPTLLNEQREKYIHTVPTLPAEGAQRLVYFQDFLESSDEMLARDAYDEFARAPYQDVIDLQDEMNHAQLVAWIKNPDIPASRRRLYLTMLGVCGDLTDADMLEGMLRSDDRKLQSGLDAMIACFLRLRGEAGLKTIEDLYLRNKETEYADTYSAIMALRFHGEETDVIPRERIAKSMHVMLDRPELADLVIVDLARWEDWSVMDRLVDLFKNADDKSSWVRVPVVRYLMACPQDEAKKHLEALEKIDAGAVRRAKTFFPFEEKEEETTSALEIDDGTQIAATHGSESQTAEADAPDTNVTLVSHRAKVPAATPRSSSHRENPKPYTVAPAKFDFANLYVTGGVLIAMAAVASIYGAAQRFSRN